MVTRFEIAFRTIRVGSLKTFPPRDSQRNKLKLTKDELKFKVVLEQKQNKNEAFKIVIPTKNIILLEGYIMRGCPVIWVTTDIEAAKKIRRSCGMQLLTYPTPYFDPESHELANQRIAIIPADDPINQQQLVKFRTIVRFIAAERSINVDMFFREFTRVDCNEQLVQCTRYISQLTKLIKIKQEIKSEPELIPSRKKIDEYTIIIPSSSSDEDDAADTFTIKRKTKHFASLKDGEVNSSITGTFPSSQIKTTSNLIFKSSPSVSNNTTKVILPTVTPSNDTVERDSLGSTNSSLTDSLTLENKRKNNDSSSILFLSKRKKFQDQPGNIAIIKSKHDDAENLNQANLIQDKWTKVAADGNQFPLTHEPQSIPNIVENLNEKPANFRTMTHSNIPSSKIDVKSIRGTASLSSHMQTLHQDMESMLSVTPLCICAVKSQYALNSAHKITCMAIDNIDGRLTGCINFVTEPYMMRPSKNLPVHGLCGGHRDRMIQHECCPGCGTFCAGGTFLVCQGTAQHRFHRNCLVLTRHTMDCPHCGSPMSNILEVTVDPHPEYLQKYEENILEVIEKSPDKHLQPCYPDCVVRIPGVTKPVPENILLKINLKIMPQREGLNVMLSGIETDLPKKLRFQAKSLIQLVKQGDAIKVAQLLCGTSGDPNARNSSNLRTALHEAVARGNMQVMHMLITAGADVNTQDEDGKTPIFYAEEQCRLDIVKYLITCNANLIHSDSEGMVPLHHAAKHGRLESCLTLLKYGMDQLNCKDEGGWTPFVWAAEHRRINTARCLMYHDAHMHSVDNEGNICLQWAALSGNKEILLMCLRKNCDVNHQNVLGDTALHISAREDNYECVVLLLGWGADPCIPNKDRRLPAQCAKEPSLCQVALLMSSATRNAITDHKGFEPFDRERLLSSDISRGKEKIAISCVNGVDEAPCPINPPHEFLYIAKNIYKYTNVNAIMSKIKSCNCKNDCVSCSCGIQSQQCWYDAAGRLLPSFNYENPPRIYECNPLCKCSSNCRNRVIQKDGVRFRIQVFRTSNIGWGVRTLELIPKGSFVCEFIGEVIADGDARSDDFYLFDLDENPDGSFCIDGRSYGNVSRYINHHCEPNLVPVRFFYDHQDNNFPRIAFFASRDIGVREQLSFDYGDGFWDEKSENLTCDCGVKTCKYSEQIYRRRKNMIDDDSDDEIEDAS